MCKIDKFNKAVEIIVKIYNILIDLQYFVQCFPILQLRYEAHVVLDTKTFIFITHLLLRVYIKVDFEYCKSLFDKVLLHTLCK